MNLKYFSDIQIIIPPLMFCSLKSIASGRLIIVFLLNFFDIIFLFYGNELFACKFVCVAHESHFPERPENVARSTGTGIMDSPEPPCECWECNPGSLQKQQMLLTTEALLFSPEIELSLGCGSRVGLWTLPHGWWVK